MWLHYASSKPFIPMGLSLVALVLTARYFIVGVEKGTHTFVDVHDYFFHLHGLNATTTPVLHTLRRHLIDNYTTHETVFLVHVLATAVAWGLMPFQIWSSFRNSNIARHRIVGKVSMAALAVGMTTSFVIARDVREIEEAGGFTTEVGFYGMAVATSFCAVMGIVAIKKGNVEEHRKWMVRTYGTMWGAFFWFRIAMVVLLPLLPDKYNHVLGLISNLSWMSGWMGADLSLSLANSNNRKSASDIKKAQ